MRRNPLPLSQLKRALGTSFAVAALISALSFEGALAQVIPPDNFAASRSDAATQLQAHPNKMAVPDVVGTKSLKQQQVNPNLIEQIKGVHDFVPGLHGQAGGASSSSHVSR